jgi:hypothetical protein
MKSTLLLLALVPLLVGVGACGGTNSASRQSNIVAANVAGEHESESKALDHDDERYPNDDTSTIAGHPGPGYVVTAADRRKVATLVKRYYMVALAGDGASACSMLYSSIAKALPGDYGRASGAQYMRRETCAAVASKLFKHFHRQIAAEVPILRIASMRFHEGRGRVYLWFRNIR